MKLIDILKENSSEEQRCIDKARTLLKAFKQGTFTHIHDAPIAPRKGTYKCKYKIVKEPSIEVHTNQDQKPKAVIKFYLDEAEIKVDVEAEDTGAYDELPNFNQKSELIDWTSMSWAIVHLQKLMEKFGVKVSWDYYKNK